MTARVVLKKGREKSLLNRHPWVFSGAVSVVDGKPEPGETVEIVSHQGHFLAWGAFSSMSQIRVRAWSFDSTESVSTDFFRDRIKQAVSRRQSILIRPDVACRLIYAESDALPGVIVDKYADFLVCQFLSVGAERWKRVIVDILVDLIPCRGIYERSDASVREKEGLLSSIGVLWGEPPVNPIMISEGNLIFHVDVKAGHKTGFYLDQRNNRFRAAQYCTDREILNCFCYTGAFGIHAIKAGAAHVTQVDASAPSLTMAKVHAEINSCHPARMDCVEADVFHLLRRYRDSRKQFDVIILDPPKFAESRSQVEKAARGYKDINLLAMKLLRPDGILITFSCSGMIDLNLFQKIVADAATDANRFGQIIEWLHQATDHPVGLNFPEGLYLKGLVCRIA
ncbi:MAG: class I SAM-dependent methyltransferase [Desulfatirhabdiaceae bacterium]